LRFEQRQQESFVESESKKRTVPVWAWLGGGLVLLMACAVIVALGAAALAIFVVDSNQDASAPVVAAVETVVVEADAGPALTIAPTPTAMPEQTPMPEVQVTVTSEAEPLFSPPAGNSQDSEAEFDDPYADQRATIEANVASIRQLEPRAPVSPVSVTSEELRLRLEEELLEEYDQKQAQADAITLSAFDFLPADFDLYNLILDLFTEQIAGYYDPETDEFVIVSDDGGFGVLEQVTHAHEYVHALQDQYYNLELLDDEELDSEAAFAVQALAEGEATFVQTQFMLGGYFGTEQLLDLMQESLTVDTAVLDSAPPVIVRELEFPYLGGLEFVQALYAQGGYEAIDAAWRNLPQSSEHILHPQRYLAGDAPQLVSVAPLTDTLGAGWALADEDTLGEFYLREFLGQQLANADVDQAATGWGGDRYAVYWHESDQSLVMVLRLAWDTPVDAGEFAQRFPRYPEGLYADASQSQVRDGRCWSGTDVICLFVSGDETLIVRAPDTDMADQVATAQLSGQ
jgi:hypothetical protein